jgi:hypothetical protein
LPNITLLCCSRAAARAQIKRRGAEGVDVFKVLKRDSPEEEKRD